MASREEQQIELRACELIQYCGVGQELENEWRPHRYLPLVRTSVSLASAEVRTNSSIDGEEAAGIVLASIAHVNGHTIWPFVNSKDPLLLHRGNEPAVDSIRLIFYNVKDPSELWLPAEPTRQVEYLTCNGFAEDLDVRSGDESTLSKPGLLALLERVRELSVYDNDPMLRSA